MLEVVQDTRIRGLARCPFEGSLELRAQTLGDGQLRLDRLALLGAGGIALLEDGVACGAELLPQPLVDATRNDADGAPTTLQRLDLVDAVARIPAGRCDRGRFGDDGLFRGGVAFPLEIEFFVQAGCQCIELGVELATCRAIDRMVFAPLVARRVQNSLGGAPVGALPVDAVEVTGQFRTDLATLFEVEFARRRLCIEILATGLERIFGRLIETVEQAPVAVVRDRPEILPSLPQFADALRL